MTILRRGVLSLSFPLCAAVAAAAPAWLDTRVTVDVKHAPLATFLDTLSAQAKVNFILTEGTQDQKVTAFLHDVTVREALEVLKESKEIDYVQLARTNTYIIAPKGSPALSPQPAIEGGKELETKVTVRLKNAPLDHFFDAISAQTRSNFVLDEGLEKMKITVFLQNVTAREALEIIMRLKGLTSKPLDAAKTYKMSRR